MTPANQLWLGTIYAYLDTQVKVGVNAGNVLPRAPRHKLGPYLERSWSLPHGQLSGRLEYRCTDGFNTEVPNARAAFIPGYGLVDARIEYEFADKHTVLSL